MILTSGTTGTPKGAQRSSPDGLCADRGDDRQDPLPQPRDDDGRGAALSLLGLRPLRARPADRLDPGPAAPLRPRGDAAGGRRSTAPTVLAVVPVMIQRILQLPRGDARLLRPLLAADHRAVGLGAAGRAGDRVDGPLRRQHLQPLRLDRGRLGRRSPRRRTCGPRPGTAGRPPRGTVVKIFDEARQGGAAGRGRADLRRQRDGLRGLHRRRRQGGRSTACSAAATSATSTSEGRLFIDGRDDEMIVSGGENVFPREVEDLLADHEAVVEVAVIGVEDEEFGQRLKAFVVARRAEVEVSDDELKGARQGEPRLLQGAARDRVPRRAAAQRDRQGAQARAPRPRAAAVRLAALRLRRELEEDGSARDAAAAQRRLEAVAFCIRAGVISRVC